MAIAYPIAFPTTKAPNSITISAESVTGYQQSPFNKKQTIYSYPGQEWKADVSLPPMTRADAEVWIAFLLSLRGMEGTFLMGDPVGAVPRGTWTGGLCLGAQAARTGTLLASSLGTGKTGKAGDWLQLGSGATARLHKLLQDFAVGSPDSAALEIWPTTKDAVANGDAITVLGAKGVWRLSAARASWSVQEAQVYGISFSAVEAQ